MQMIPMYLYELQNELGYFDDFNSIDDLHIKVRKVMGPYGGNISCTGSIIIISDAIGFVYITLAQGELRVIQGYCEQEKIVYVECYQKKRLYLGEEKSVLPNQGVDNIKSWFSVPVIVSRYAVAPSYEIQSDSFQKIADYCINTDILSISKLQCGLRIGYNKASNGLKWLQNQGWIEPLSNGYFKVCVLRKLRK